MTMAKLRIKMIPARIIREKGKEVAVTPRGELIHPEKDYLERIVENPKETDPLIPHITDPR